MRLTAERTKRIEVPNDPDNGFIVIRDLSLEAIACIEGKYMHVTDKEVRLDNYAERDGAFARACLTDFGNLYNQDDVNMKFTPQNVEVAAGLAIKIGEDKLRFFDWIHQEFDKFHEEVAEEEVKAIKN